MKRLLKKISILILIISFTIQPILQITIGLGEVSAATVSKRYVTTNTNRSEELNTKIDPKTEDAKIVRTEYKYTVYYQKSVNLNIIEDDLSLFSIGRNIMTSNSIKKVLVQNLTKVSSKTKLVEVSNGFWGLEKVWSCALVLGGEYYSDWYNSSKKVSDFPRVPVKYSSRNYEINTELIPQKITHTQTRYVWEVTQKNSSSSTVVNTPSKEEFKDIIEEVKPNVTPKPSTPSYSGTSTGGYTPPIIPQNNINQIKDVEEKNINITNDAKVLYTRNLYTRVLQREPSMSEINSHISKSVHKITSDIILSPESNNKNKINTISNEEFVKLCYKFILGREEDKSGLINHTAWLNKGNSRENLIRVFVNSDEYIGKTVKTAQNISLNKDTCKEVYRYLKNENFIIVKSSDTNIIMYLDDVLKVEQLKMEGYGLTDLTGISSFKNLKTLYIPHNNISDLNEISKLTNLEKLYLNCNKVKLSLKGIEKLTNLKYLNLSNNLDKLVDVSYMGKLYNLEVLDLNKANLKNNVSAVWNLTKLTTLKLNNNGLTSENLNNINKLSKLKLLYLNDNNLNSLSSITKLTNLETLQLDNNCISNIDNIDNLKNIKSISIKNNIIEVNTTIQQLDIIDKVLKSGNILSSPSGVQFTNCTIENGKIVVNNGVKKATIEILSGIASGTKINIINTEEIITLNDKALADKLQNQLGNIITKRVDTNENYQLHIDSANLYSIAALDLSYINSDNIKIRDITGLDKFVNLQNLNLQNNEVTNLDELAKLKKLNTLNISYNRLENLNKISNLKTLKQLDVSNNYIKDINAISNLQELNTLILSNNNIANNLEPLNGLKNLSLLVINNNNISDLSSISSLKLTGLYASYNNISDISKLNTEELDILEMKNNSITINIQNTETQLVNILKNDIEKNGGLNNLKCTNCTIKENKIILNEGQKVGQVCIKNGNFSDTVVTIQSLGDKTPPVLKVSSKLNPETGELDVTIISNEKVQRPSGIGWNVSEDQKKLTKSYKYNTIENLRVRDLYGNEIVQKINVTDIKNDKVPGLMVYYSSYDASPTNKDVTVIIKADVPLGKMFQSDPWILSEDGKTLQRTFTNKSYGNKMIITKANLDEANNNGGQSLSENIVHVGYSVENIDKDAPQLEVEYSSIQKTKSAVIATIWSDEEISLTNDCDNFVSIVSKVDDEGNVKYGISLFYPENMKERIQVSDLAGNISMARIQVENIDSSVDGLYSVMDGNCLTNSNVSLTIKANEKIKAVDQSKSQLSTKLQNKVFGGKFDVTKISAMISESSTKNEYSYRLAGDTNVLPIMDGYTNAVKNENMIFLSETSANQTTVELLDENELKYTLTESTSGIVHVSDELDNTGVTLYNANIIDKDAPVIQREDDIIDENGNVKVTLVSNEEIVKTDDMVGWTLGEDRTTLIKSFSSNKYETLTIQDLAGNTVDIEVVVDNVGMIDYKVIYEAIEETDKVLVMIVADVELEQLEGWKLSKDRKSLGKVIDKDEKFVVTIEDINGVSEDVSIELLTEFNEQNNENKDNNDGNQDSNKEDNTQSDKDFPQTGKYSIISGTLIIILTILTVAVLVYDNKKYNN